MREQEFVAKARETAMAEWDKYLEYIIHCRESETWAAGAPNALVVGRCLAAAAKKWVVTREVGGWVRVFCAPHVSDRLGNAWAFFTLEDEAPQSSASS